MAGLSYDKRRSKLLSALNSRRAMMRLAGAARQVGRLLWRQRPAILMYHRIAEEGFDPWGLAVPSATFNDQLRWLRRRRIVLPLEEFARRHRNGSLPRRAIAITFDDGYACNGHTAAPLLARHRLSATVFLCPELIRTGEECWWDDLERIVLTHSGETLMLALADEQTVVLGPRDPRDRNWPADAPPVTARQAAFLDIWTRLRPLEPTALRQAIKALRAQAETPSMPRASHRLMTLHEILAAQAKGIVMGAHSMTHTALSERTEAEQERELAASRRGCAEITGQTPACVAYPYGDHNDASVRLAREAGFVCACTTEHASVGRYADLYRLPRLRIGNWSGREMGRALARA